MATPTSAIRWSLLLTIVAACMASPDAAPALAKKPRTLLLYADPAQTIQDSLHVDVTVADANGRESTGLARTASSATTQLVGELLVLSLRKQGCMAQHTPAEPGPEGMIRWMRRAVVLPDGWHFVRASATTGRGAPTSAIELHLEGPAR